MSAAFKPIRVLGLMSGTSFDGVDGAIIETDGETDITFGQSEFEAYSDPEREILRNSMGQWPGVDLSKALDVVHTAHLRLARRLDADLVGFHGQTLAHDPSNARTHQLGDGAFLAKHLGKTVVWNFRTDDMKNGGQGAPLAPFFHHALARRGGLEGPIVFLNLGGVANVSWVDPSETEPTQEGALVACDTGPANALLDDFLGDRLGLAYDKDGRVAAQGQVIDGFFEGLSDHSFLGELPPKSLDRNDFSSFQERCAEMSTEDGAACLTELTARCISAALRFFPSPPKRWLVCGGGRRNPVMLSAIEAAVGAQVQPVEAIGLDGDMLEAQAFGWLAVRVLRGLATSGPSTTGAKRPVSGGTVSKI